MLLNALSPRSEELVYVKDLLRKFGMQLLTHVSEKTFDEAFVFLHKNESLTAP